MKKFKLLVMTAIVLLFSVSSLYSYNRDFKVVRYVSATLKAMGWSSSELELGVVKFDLALAALAANLEDEEYVQLHFELLWSRLNTLLEGKESRPLREQPGVQPMLEGLVAQLTRWEDRVYALKANDHADIAALRHESSHGAHY